MVAVRVTVRGDSAVLRRLRAAQRAALDYSDPLTEWGDELADSTARGFATQGASLGEPWAPNAPDYGAFKLRDDGTARVLVDEGTLEASVTRRPFPIDRVGPRGATFGTDVFGARFVQQGTEDMPARPFFVVPPTLASELRRVLRAHVAGPLRKG